MPEAMKSDVEGEFDITVDDLRRAAREMPETRFVRWMPPLVILPGFAVGVWGSGKTNEFFVYFMICLAIAIGIALSGGKGAARRELKNIRPEARHVRFRLDEHGVEFETRGASSKRGYHALYGFVEGKHLFLLYTQPAHAQLIPKRVLTGEQLTLVRNWTTQVPPRKRRLGPWYLLVIWLVLIILFLLLWQGLNIPDEPVRLQ